MERYTQFRDRGTAIAPFLPVPAPATHLLWAPIHLVIFLCRLPFVLCISFLYFCILEWIPVGSAIKHVVLWLMLSVPGVWWVDLQVDGVKRGQLHSSKNHLPAPGTIIASSFTSPLDPLYLAGIFQPLFTRSFVHTRLVEPITLFRAILLAFRFPTLSPPDPSQLTSLARLGAANPHKIICVFPETTTTNGRAILPLSPSLLSAGGATKIYPVNLRYTPQDITTPIPGAFFSWFWRLLSKPTHQMRVRIASRVYNSPSQTAPTSAAASSSREEQHGNQAFGTGYDTNIFDSPEFTMGVNDKGTQDTGMEVEVGEQVGIAEQKVLDRVGEDLARLGRVKRVGLGVQDKVEFLKLYGKKRR